MTSAVLPVYFRPPLENPTPNGLYSVTNWTEDDSARWLMSGVEFRDGLDPNNNEYFALAERPVVVGYERVFAAVEVTG